MHTGFKKLFYLALAGGAFVLAVHHVFSDIDGGISHPPSRTDLVLVADIANASVSNLGGVTIPFKLKNISSKDIALYFDRDSAVVHLDFLDPSGRFLSNSPMGFMGGGPSFVVHLKPGHSREFDGHSSVEELAAVRERKVVGVLWVRGLGLTTTSLPVSIPSELTIPPYNDLGATNYLSVRADVANINLGPGGHSLRVQPSDPGYVDWLRNGDVVIAVPVIVKNISNQEIVVSMDSIDLYICPDEKFREDLKHWEKRRVLTKDTPILKPGESVCSENVGRADYVFRWLGTNQGRKYQPGDKMIAVVCGRFANTKTIFVCYSPPFELLPPPRSGP
jgi:hypothetical protein